MGAKCSAVERCSTCQPALSKELKAKANVQLAGHAVIQRSKRVAEIDGDVKGYYEVSFGPGSVLHRTAKATLSKGKSRKHGHVRALKMPRDGLAQSEWWRNEVDALSKCDHPHVCRLFEYFTGVGEAALPCQVLELCLGRSLENFCRSERALLESQESMSGLLVHQMSSAVAHLHSHGYCHLELTPDDYFFSRAPSSRSPALGELSLKLLSLGLCERIDPKPPQLLERAKGAVYHTKGEAPEQVEAHSRGMASVRSDLCDSWGIGVLAFFVLTGDWPVVEAGIVRAESWRGIRPKAKQFVQMFLKVDPVERVRVGEHLEQSAWMLESQKAYRASILAAEKNAGVGAAQAAAKRALFTPPKMTDDKIVQAFKVMAGMTGLQRAAITAAVHRLPEEKTAYLRHAFERLDANGNGTLSVQELVFGLGQAVGRIQTTEEWEQILGSLDTDGSRTIDYTEFVTATYCVRQDLRDEVCEAAFELFDADQSGKVTLAEIRKVLGIERPRGGSMAEGLGGERELIGDFDDDGDGEIDLDEFKRLLRGPLADGAGAGQRKSNPSPSKGGDSSARPRRPSPRSPRKDDPASARSPTSGARGGGGKSIGLGAPPSAPAEADALVAPPIAVGGGSDGGGRGKRSAASTIAQKMKRTFSRAAGMDKAGFPDEGDGGGDDAWTSKPSKPKKASKESKSKRAKAALSRGASALLGLPPEG